MRKLYKNRPRLLLICSDTEVKNQLVTLISGYDYWVDAFEDLPSGYSSFKAYRHQVVMIDEAYLGKGGDQTVDLFKKIQRYCVVLGLVPAYRPNRVEQLMKSKLYDVVETPVFPEHLHHKIRRVVQFHKIVVLFNYFRFLILFMMLVVPLVLIIT